MTELSPEAQLAYDQALRVVPAMLTARFRGSKQDAMVLVSGFFDEMAERTTLNAEELWATLFSAAATWFANCIRALGRTGGDDPLEILQQMSMAAASWEAEGE